MKCGICKRLTVVSDLGENIWVIVITGGPCSGKTTSLARLESTLTDRGHKVLVVPETATKLIAAGMKQGELPSIDFQEQILHDTLGQEERIFAIAKKYRDDGHKVVILCDRGTMDGEAYVGTEAFTELLKRFDYSPTTLCNQRYHAVIHLRTAALGAEKFYTLENNKTRSETPEEARDLDARTLCAWTRHHRPRTIDNSTDFDGKLKRLVAEVCAIIGDPVPLEKEERYLIEQVDPAEISVPWRESLITQDYLTTTDLREERRVRLRTTDGKHTYYHTYKRYVKPGIRVEVERIITANEYRSLLELKDPQAKTIVKSRICFFWKEQFTEIDLFDQPCNVAIMEVERTDESREVEIPPFIKVVKRVTEEDRYDNSSIARKGLVSVR